MADPLGFMKYKRAKHPYRPVKERKKDWNQVMARFDSDSIREQASRCMDCGIPFCHNSCPLGNLIPEWNDLARKNQWEEALVKLHATNNFPEFTGTLCPAPCEGSCVLGINDQPVSIKSIELEIIDRGFEMNLIKPLPPKQETRKTVAIIGSGPAGLAAAQQLRRVGHRVTVFEKDDRAGGLLRYGIPEFKMEKNVLERRLNQLTEEGIEFQTKKNIGQEITIDELKKNFNAVLIAGGASISRDIEVPGRNLQGIHFAMDFLSQQNRVCEGDDTPVSRVNAEGKRVIIIGGGDTGADCLGTAHRQGAKLVTSLEIMPRPPLSRAMKNPWPEWPRIYKIASAHEEGGERRYAASTTKFIGNKDNQITAIEIIKVEQVDQPDGTVSFAEVPNSKHEIPCDLVLLAMGFTGPHLWNNIRDSGIKLDKRQNIEVNPSWMTSIDGVFAAGDAKRGQSLIVWAIAEGRSAARAIDEYLMGTSSLPAPV
ncbi:MAG: glutamate synthase [Methylococcaceae bacterium TMED69]|nr:MAG: glutamate synthase [Methylococcaceae bacterium TMED69]